MGNDEQVAIMVANQMVDTSAGMRYFSEYNWTVSPAMLVAPSCAYVVLAIAGHFAMQRFETPSWVPTAMRAYNIGQIVLCLYMTAGLAPVLGFPNVFGIGSAYSYHGEWFIFVHYLSKYFDWFDTLWMILKKKSSQQMSFLHLYHHATIGVVWGFLLSTGHGNGGCRYGAWVNSLTHVLMYSHYLWTSFGYSNPFKKLLTTWQIFQFYTCFAHAVCVLFIFSSMEIYVPIKLAWLQFAYHITMVYLFTFKLHWVPKCLKLEGDVKSEGAKQKLASEGAKKLAGDKKSD